MCTFNGAKFIDEQLQSIIDQDYPIYEIIVVDDLSTDATFQILERWREKFPKLFKLFRNEINLGFNKNFEKAFSLCSGDLISIADQDDIWMPDKFKCLAPLFTQENVMLAHGASLTLKNGKLHHFSGQLKRYHLFEGSDSRKLMLFNQISGHNMIFRRSILQKALPIPKEMYYDWWLAIQATAQGTVKSYNKYLVHHRKHSDNSFFGEKRKKIELSDLERLDYFQTIDSLGEKTISFILSIKEHLLNRKKNTQQSNLPYFKFLFKHRGIIFGHKKRIFPLFTHLTDSVKYSK